MGRQRVLISAEADQVLSPLSCRAKSRHL